MNDMLDAEQEQMQEEELKAEEPERQQMSKYEAFTNKVRGVKIADDVAAFITTVVSATRRHPAIRFGASPRGTLGLARMARALSFLRGCDYVDPAVVRELAAPVLTHRIILKAQSGESADANAVIAELLAQQRTPR